MITLKYLQKNRQIHSVNVDRMLARGQLKWTRSTQESTYLHQDICSIPLLAILLINKQYKITNSSNYNYNKQQQIN